TPGSAGHASTAANWPKFRFDSANTGVNPFETTLNPSNVSGLHPLWTAHTGAAISSSPAVVNGTLYVGSWDASVYAFDAVSGAPTLAWIDSSPDLTRTTVYVGSFDQHRYAFNALTGAQLWAAPTGGSIDSSPAVSNGAVYVESMDGDLWSFDASTGGERWHIT